MKFTSTKRIKGKAIETNAAFDIGLVHSIKQEQEVGWFTARYSSAEIGNPTNMPFETKYTTLVIKITDDDIYIGALCCIDYENGSVKPFKEYVEDDIIEFSVKLYELEKRKLLLALLKQLTK